MTRDPRAQWREPQRVRRIDADDFDPLPERALRWIARRACAGAALFCLAIGFIAGRLL